MTDLALRHPFCDHPYAQKLSKNLGDLGRGNEVSFLAELVSALGTGRVVAAIWGGEALTHVRCYGNWAGGLERELVHRSIEDDVD